jgi:hypothetical protein
MGGMPPQQWQGGVQYYMASPGGPAIPPGMPPYGSGMYDEGPRGVGLAAGMDPLRPTSAPTPAERRSSRSSSIDRQAYRTGSFGKSNRGSRKSRHSSHSSAGGAAADDEEGDPLSDAITTKLVSHASPSLSPCCGSRFEASTLADLHALTSPPPPRPVVVAVAQNHPTAQVHSDARDVHPT